MTASLPEARDSLRYAALVKSWEEGLAHVFFNPAQPRDARGRWSPAGGGGFFPLQKTAYEPYPSGHSEDERVQQLPEGGGPDITRRGPYGKGDVVFRNLSESQREMVETALSHIPDSVKAETGQITFQMKTKDQLDEMIGHRTTLIRGVTDITIPKIWLNSDDFPMAMTAEARAQGIRTTIHEYGHAAVGPSNHKYALAEQAWIETFWTCSYSQSHPMEAAAEAFVSAIINPRLTMGPKTERMLREEGFER